MRKRKGEPFAPTRDIPLPPLAQDGPAGRLQLWAARAANDPRAAPQEASGVVRPRPGTPRPSTHQDADWDNDATTLFRRDASLLGDSQPAAQPIVSELRSSEPPAIEGGLRRSLWPESKSALRPLWYALPVVAVFCAIGLWSERGLSWKMATPEWWVAAATPARPHLLSRGLPAVEPPTREQMRELPAPAAAQTLAATVAPVEPPAEQAEPPRARKGSRWQHGAVSARHATRDSQRTRRAKNASVARRIEPLVEPADDDDTSASEPASEGTLQVNSRPWARVIVDGNFVGNTPQRGLKLAAGKHRVQLVNDQLEMSKILDVNISPGQTVTRIEMLDENAP